MSNQFPKTMYARVVNPGTPDEFTMTSSDLNDVSDENICDNDSVSPDTARYELVGIGQIHHTAPRYVETKTT